MSKRVRKAVFPAGGLGTRFLPATKVIPKEMLALVDKPIIQYGVEEAIASGIEHIIIVTGRGKGAMEDHFDISFELDATLERRGKNELLAVSRGVCVLARISYVRQKEPLGLGHAVLCAKDLVGDEPFAVILPDDVIDAEVPCLKQMIDVFDEKGGSVLATQTIEGPGISAYGVLAGAPDPATADLQLHRHGGEAEVRGGALEAGHHRPLCAHAAGLRVAGADQPGAGGEIQLTDGIRRCSRKRRSSATPSRASASMPAISSACCRRRWSLRSSGRSSGRSFGQYLKRVGIVGSRSATAPGSATPQTKCALLLTLLALCLPFDVAADRGPLVCGYGLAGKHQIDGARADLRRLPGFRCRGGWNRTGRDRPGGNLRRKEKCPACRRP